MKKTILYTFVCLLAAMAVSCGGGSDSKEKEVNWRKPTAYIEAINANDYTTAHEVLDKLYANYYLKYCEEDVFHADEVAAYWDAAKYIYKAEMQYLLPMNDADANRRLVFTLQSMNAPRQKPNEAQEYSVGKYQKTDAYMKFCDNYNRLCDEILEISITSGTEDMANQIVKLYKDEYIPSQPNRSTHAVISYTVDKGSKQRAKERLAEAKAEGSFE